MAEVLRVVVPRIEMTPLRASAEPVVLRGITLAPRHGVRVRVERVEPERAGSRSRDALAA